MALREQDGYAALAKFCEQFETVSAAAKALGISKQYLGDILQNHRDLTPMILKKIGLRKAVVKA